MGVRCAKPRIVWHRRGRRGGSVARRASTMTEVRARASAGASCGAAEAAGKEGGEGGVGFWASPALERGGGRVLRGQEVEVASMPRRTARLPLLLARRKTTGRLVGRAKWVVALGER